MGNRISAPHSTGQLTEEDIENLSKQTYFNPDEIRKWHHQFLKDCPSGYLRKQEFQAIYRQVFPNGNPAKFSDFVFNVFDKDMSGSITFSEFMIALSKTSRGNLDEKLTWAFSLYDINGDGHISREEMVQIICSIYEMIGDAGGDAVVKANHIFDRMDFNGDGYLTFEEFRGVAKANPWIVQALTMDPSHHRR